MAFIGIGQAQAQIYVSTTGNDFNEGTQASPKRTIQGGINAADPGETVFVQPGFYDETATVNERVELVANGGDVTVTTLNLSAEDATDDGNRAIIRGANAGDDFVVRGLGVQGGYFDLQGDPLILQDGYDLTWSAGTAVGGARLSAPISAQGGYDLTFANTDELVLEDDQLPQDGGNALAPTTLTFANTADTETPAELVAAGATTINAGAEAAFGPGTTLESLTNNGTITQGPVTVEGALTNGGTVPNGIVIDAQGNVANNGSFASGSTLNLLGNGAGDPETLSGTGSFAGVVNVEGDYDTTSDVTFSSSAVLNLNAGTLDVSGGDAVIQGDLVFNGGATDSDDDGRFVFSGNSEQEINLNGGAQALGNVTVNKGPLNELLVMNGTSLTVNESFDFEAGRINLMGGSDLVVNGEGTLSGVVTADDAVNSVLQVSNTTAGEDNAVTIEGNGRVLVPIEKTGVGIVALNLSLANSLTVTEGELRFNAALEMEETLTVEGGELVFNASGNNLSGISVEDDGAVTFNESNNTVGTITATNTGNVTFNGTDNNLGDVTLNVDATLVFAAEDDEGVRTSTIDGNVTNNTGEANAVLVQSVDDEDYHVLVLDGEIMAGQITLQNNAGLSVTGDFDASEVVFGLANENRLAFVGDAAQDVQGTATVSVLEFANAGGVELQAGTDLTVEDALLLSEGTVSAPNNNGAITITATGAAVTRSGGSLSGDTDSADPVLLTDDIASLTYSNSSAITTGEELASVPATSPLSFEGSAAVTLGGGATVNDLNINEGATVDSDGETISVVGAGTGNATPVTVNGEFTGSGAVAFTATGASAVSGTGSVSNLDVDADGNTVTLSGAATIADLDLTPNGGTVNLAADAAISDLSAEGTGTVNFASNGPDAIAGPAEFSGPAINVNRTVTVEGDLTVEDGSTVTLGVEDFDLIVEGDDFTFDPAVAGTEFVFNGNGRLVLAGDAEMDFTLGTDAAIQRLEIANAEGVTLTEPFALTVNDLVLTAGTFNTGGLLNLEAGRLTVQGGTLEGEFSDDAAPAELVFSGADSINATGVFSGTLTNVTVDVEDGAVVTLDSTGAGATIDGVLTLENGTLVVEDGLAFTGTSQIVRMNGAIEGNIDVDDEMTVRYRNSEDVTTGAELSSGAIGNLIVEAADSTDATVTLGSDATAGTVTLTSGTLDLAQFDLTTSGNVVVNTAFQAVSPDDTLAVGRLILSGDGAASITGDFGSLPGLLVNKGQDNNDNFVAVTLDSDEDAVTINGDLAVESGDLFVDASVDALDVNGDFNLMAGAHQFDANGADLNVAGNFFALAATDDDDAAAVLNLGEVTLDGSMMQTVDSDFDFDGGLVIDNAAGVMLESNVIATTLDLEAGRVYTGENWLRVSVADPAALEGNGMIVGTLQRAIDAQGTYRYPLADSLGHVRRVDIVNQEVFGTVPFDDAIVEIEHQGTPPSGELGLPITDEDGNVVVDDLAPFYWTATLVDGTANSAAGARFNVFGGGLNGVQNVAQLRLVGRPGEDEALNPWNLFGEHVQSLYLGGTAVVVHQNIGGFDIATTQQFTIGGPFNFVGATFAGNLSGLNEVPPVQTDASGSFTATLNNNVLTISGTYQDLSSPLRNAGNLGPAHIHIAPAGENGPIVFPLQVTPATADSGAFSGTFTLADTLVQALGEGNLYVNIHTENFPAGELRGQILQQPNAAPAAATITSPADGETVVIGGGEGQDPVDPATQLTVSWESVSDPNGNDVVYVWQLSADENFGDDAVVVSINTGGETSLTLDYSTIAAILDEAGVELFGSATVYHRVVTTDGSAVTEGPAASVVLTRGTLTDTEDSELPTEFAVEGNYPNPFNPSTSIQFDLPATAEVHVEIFDMLGRRVMTVPQQTVQAGANRTLQVNAGQLASGAYVYRIVAKMAKETKVGTGRMTLVK